MKINNWKFFLVCGLAAMLWNGMNSSNFCRACTPIPDSKYIDVYDCGTLNLGGETLFWPAQNTYHIKISTDSTYPKTLFITNGTLIIEPGAIVKLDPNVNMTVDTTSDSEGYLTACGKPYQPIIFTSSHDKNLGQIVVSDIAVSTDEYFNTIEIGKGSQMGFCRVMYGKTGITIKGLPASKIQHNVIHNCTTGIEIPLTAISSSSDKVTLFNNLIYSCGQGVAVPGLSSTSGTVDIYNNTIDSCTAKGVYINSTPCSKLVFKNNLFTNMNTTGVYAIEDSDGTDDPIRVNNGYYQSATNGCDYGDPNTQLSYSPYDSTNTALGGHYLNSTTGGGESLLEAGSETVTAAGYLDPNDWALKYPATVIASNTTYSTTQTWEPNTTICDSGTVAIGYHHPRVDVLIYHSKITAANGGTPFTFSINPGTVIAQFPVRGTNYDYIDIGQNCSLNCAGNPFTTGEVIFVQGGLASESGADAYYHRYDPFFVIEYNAGAATISHTKFLAVSAAAKFLQSVSISNSTFWLNNGPITDSYSAGGTDTSTVTNCLFSENSGGGIYLANSTANVQATNCSFTGESMPATVIVDDMAGIYGESGCTFIAKNCIFTEMPYGLAGAGNCTENNNAFYEVDDTTQFNSNTLNASDWTDPLEIGTNELDGKPFLAITSWYGNPDNRFFLKQDSGTVDGGDSAITPQLEYTTSIYGLVDSAPIDIGYHYLCGVKNTTRGKIYNSIASAIGNANENDVILLSQREYNENITVNKIVTIQGYDSTNWDITASTILNASAAGSTITLSANTIVEGITICGGTSYGINCTAGSPVIQNCLIRNNGQGGIYCDSGSPDVVGCKIGYNTGYGIHIGTGADMSLINSCIYKNDTAGLEFDNTSTASLVRNNTIVYNGSYGISVLSGTAPNVANCIVWGNEEEELLSCGAVYSCIEDTTSGTGNTDENPLFADETADDYHIWTFSPCTNTGNSSLISTSETDLDGKNRIISNGVDMGAYEAAAKTLYYVNGAASSDGDGLSWQTSMKYLQSALRSAVSGDEIWVTENGPYYPTVRTDSSDPYSVTFQLPAGVTIFGGFTGTESYRSERDYTANITILSGDIGTIGVTSDNCYHVVTGADDAVLDGFTITAGNAQSSQANGGGLYNDQVSPLIKNCIFIANAASANGGAIYNTGCTQSPVIINCDITANTASGSGGAVYNLNSKFISVNSILWGNTQTTGKCVANSGSSAVFSYCDIEGCGGSEINWDANIGIDGKNNIDDDPLFENAAAGDLRLKNNPPSEISPCLNIGVDGENIGLNGPAPSEIIASQSLNDPVDIDLDDSGNIYVLSSSQNAIYVYNDQLVQQGIAIPLSATNPMGFCRDSSGNYFIADTGRNRILKYTAAGLLDTTFDTDGILGQYGTASGEFNQPRNIAVGYDGYIYVTDSGNNRVEIFDPNGVFISEWGSVGSGAGQLNSPAGFYLLSDSQMYLADAGNHRIQNLSARSGSFYSEIGEQGIQADQFNNPQNVCYDVYCDQIIVSDTGNNRIQIFQLNSHGDYKDNSITFIKEIANQGLSSPHAVACTFNETGQIIYVADRGSNRILKLTTPQDMPGNGPLHTFEAFKAALGAADIDKSVSFFHDSVAEDYKTLFNLNSSLLQNMINNMGQISLESQDEGMAVYELSNIAETMSYPVVFSKDENGIWKIITF